jgi:hypothetical protein
VAGHHLLPLVPVPVQGAESLVIDLCILIINYSLLEGVRHGNPERKMELENTINRDTLTACNGPGGNVINAYMYCFYLNTVHVIVD